MQFQVSFIALLSLTIVYCLVASEKIEPSTSNLQSVTSGRSKRDFVVPSVADAHGTPYAMAYPYAAAASRQYVAGSPTYAVAPPSYAASYISSYTTYP